MTTVNDNQNGSPSLYDKLIRLLHRFFVDLRRNTGLLLLCLIIVTGVFIAFNYKKSNVYKATFTVTYEELVRKVYGDRLKKVNMLLGSNREKARLLLGLEKKELNTLKSIEATNILGEELSQDLNTDRIPFMVHIYVSDTAYIEQIEQGILNYLENGNAFLIDKRKLKIKETKDELAFIEEQLRMMDTLKHKYNNASYIPSSAAPNTRTGPTSSIYEFSYELYKKKQELIRKREMPMNLYVIDDAIVPVENRKSYTVIILAGLFTGFLLFLGIIYIIRPAIRYKG